MTANKMMNTRLTKAALFETIPSQASLQMLSRFSLGGATETSSIVGFATILMIGIISVFFLYSHFYSRVEIGINDIDDKIDKHEYDSDQ